MVAGTKQRNSAGALAGTMKDYKSIRLRLSNRLCVHLRLLVVMECLMPPMRGAPAGQSRPYAAAGFSVAASTIATNAATPQLRNTAG